VGDLPANQSLDLPYILPSAPVAQAKASANHLHLGAMQMVEAEELIKVLGQHAPAAAVEIGPKILVPASPGDGTVYGP